MSMFVASADQCGSHQLIHITDDEFLQVSSSGAVQESRLHCIMTCLKMPHEIIGTPGTAVSHHMTEAVVPHSCSWIINLDKITLEHDKKYKSNKC